MGKIGEELLKDYKKIANEYDFLKADDEIGVAALINEALVSFMKDCKNPAIWCYGEHTKMMMTDFIFELKSVKYIIDNKLAGEENSGYKIIKDVAIASEKIDGIIISSYQYRNQIKETIQSKYPEIKYLDIYDYMAAKGVFVETNYYAISHPYARYRSINRLQAEKKTREVLEAIVSEYFKIKDFQNAEKYTRCLYDEYRADKYIRLADKLKALYEQMLAAINKSCKSNVVMICIDGLRRKDIFGKEMPKIKEYLCKNSRLYGNAYSISTTTFESLIPTYSENLDLSTKYYEKNVISENECRFIKKAIMQRRKIKFYTDGIRFVDSKYIELKALNQTACEKIWNFAIDAANETNGLFYLHFLYESHFSFPNPITETPLITDGGNIMFDYIAKNGGRLRTDYGRQHSDAVKYLDDVIYPLLHNLPCDFVLFADHGSNVLEGLVDLEDIEEYRFTCHNEMLEIPLAIKAKAIETGIDMNLTSLIDLVGIVSDLLDGKTPITSKREFVKFQRSRIYNPDYKYLYDKMSHMRDLGAYEAFKFDSGYKLIVYENKERVLRDADDNLIADKNLEDKLYNKICKHITLK